MEENQQSGMSEAPNRPDTMITGEVQQLAQVTHVQSSTVLLPPQEQQGGPLTSRKKTRVGGV